MTIKIINKATKKVETVLTDIELILFHGDKYELITGKKSILITAIIF